MAAIDLSPLGETSLILGAGLAAVVALVVRCAEVDVEAGGAVTGVVADAAVDPV